jgi:iron complex outermembrane recepter protein
MTRFSKTWPLLALLVSTSPAQSQTARPSPQSIMGEEEEIVVTGQRERGAVLGDIKPTVQLDAATIRSYGATSVADLLQSLAPQLRSGQGNEPPIVLINGRRTSSFAEIRDLPSEAITRVDILPEEVALKYGYAPTRKVVNLVLRRRFRAITTEVSDSFATEGGRNIPALNLNYLRIRDAKRINIDSKVEYRSALTEAERDIVRSGTPDPRPFRTLLPETETYSLNGVFDQPLQPNLSLTLNGRVEYSQNDALTGLAPQLTHSLTEARPLTRNNTALDGHFGFLLNKEKPNWRWSVAGNYDRTDSRTLAATGFDTSAASDNFRQLSQSTTNSLDLDGTLIGSPFALPAGDVSTTLRLGFGWTGLDSYSQRSGVFAADDQSRSLGEASASIDLPIANANKNSLAVLGRLNFNVNIGTQRLSDFRSLTNWGAGFNWTPLPPLRLIFSYSQRDSAPSLLQLGAAETVTPNVAIYDFTRDIGASVNVINGGNAGLLPETRHAYKVGLTLKPLSSTDLTLTANYTHSRISNAIDSLSGSTPLLQTAFPSRFSRDSGGNLVRFDARPVNYSQSLREDVRWGVNFSMPLKSPPPSLEVMTKLRAMAPPGATPAANAAPGAIPPGAIPPMRGQAGGQAGGPGGGGRGGGFGGGGARLQFAVYHTLRFRDDVQVQPGLPLIDLLDGGTIGSNSGGRPRHELEFQGGVTWQGFGARLSADWQSSTTVNATATGSSNLRYSDLTTLNLRLFINPTNRLDWIVKYPWLRGARLTVSFDNLLNDRVAVTNDFGVTPTNLQAPLLNPQGRTVRISVRKLFF